MTVRPRRSRGARVLRAFLAMFALLVVFLIAVGIGAWWLFTKPSVDVAPGKSVQVEIARGSSTRTIAEELASKGVVRNPYMFRLTSRLEKADGKLRAGVYELSTGMPYDLVIDRLKAGPPIKYVTVTVPEGFVVDQIAARFEKQAGIPSKQFKKLAASADSFAANRPYLREAYRNSLEGYLFPKTYRVREGATAEQVIEMMLAQFDKEMAEVDVEAARRQGIEINELVTMASMIERETRVDKERRLVASVIYNRLERGMRLEIDATIEYVLPGNRFRLTYRDLELESPYNTYKYKGLPPGPISSPGLKSLQAAAKPAETDYIYYVLTSKNGTHTFATNQSDFLRAKQKSKDVFGR